MISVQLLLFLLLGTVLMCGTVAWQMKKYGIATKKSVVVAVALVITGIIGSEFWYFVENGAFGGRSLYGAIFFAPLVFWPVAKILQIPYGETLDFCAPSGCLTLALVKIQCLQDGCCQGKILYLDKNHLYVRFPSQFVEFAVFLVIAGVLFMLAARPKNRRTVFPWFLVLYGGSRFLLDFLRETSPFLFGLSVGTFWSLIAAIVGILWLVYKKKNVPCKA